jgi:ABC transport system ATP-binding/permease protein
VLSDRPAPPPDPTVEQPGAPIIGNPLGPLDVLVDGQRRTLRPTGPVVLGRSADADIPSDHRSVSRQHAVLEPGPAGWTLTDLSRNGTFVEGRQVERIHLDGQVVAHLGVPPDGVRVTLLTRGAGAPGRPPPGQQGRLTAVHTMPAEKLLIGRAAGNDIVLDDVLASERHAELRRTPGGWQLSDLGSSHGTFVNGRRVRTAPVSPADVVSIGHHQLHLRESGEIGSYVDAGDNAFQARGLTVHAGRRTLLHDISFGLPGRALLAVVGPSGAGKSTLLGALTGTRPASTGDVHYAGRSLYDDYEELRQRLAVVPQDDILHTQLTVRDALRFAARLRFPADTAEAERQARIDEVLAELGLSEHVDKRISQLSGGQRKRTGVALELLTKPSLLFLDEPTSGLDPGTDRAVMRTLRELADDGRTVVVVTHNVANLEVCDLMLVLAEGGWLAYLGPPDEAPAYFGADDHADVFLKLGQAGGEQWAERYRRSAPRYVGDTSSAAHPAGRPPVSRSQPDSHRPRAALTQFTVLCRRYLAVITADRQYAIFLAVLPLVLSLLARAVPGEAGLSVATAAAAGNRQPGLLLLVLVVGAALMGAAAAIRELVKERPIYVHERAVGLSAGAYLLSKIVVLTVVVGLEATVFTAASLAGRPGADDPLLAPGNLEILFAVLLVGVATMLMGLLISALIDNADRGMPLLVLMIMAQLVFSGGLFPVHDRLGLEQLAWLAPARWAFAMAAASTDLAAITPGQADPLWRHDSTVWAADAAILGAMAVGLAALAAASLRRWDPQRRR